MKPLTETATDVWHELAKHHAKPFETAQARIFAISAEGFSRVLVTGGDVYRALDQVTEYNLNADEIGIGVETCGWAAPVSEGKTAKQKRDNELAPSEHPKRRRCRLITLVNLDEQAGSALGFSDEPDEVITDAGQAKGSLADALITAMRMIIGKNN